MKSARLLKNTPAHPAQDTISEASRPSSRARFLHLDRWDPNAASTTFRPGSSSRRLRTRTWTATAHLQKREAFKRLAKTRSAALKALRALAQLPAPSPGTPLPALLQKRTQKRTADFVQAMEQFEVAKRASPEPTERFGAAHTQARFDQLSDKQLSALSLLVTRFSSAEGIGLPKGVLAKGVRPASERVLLALAGALASPHASVPPDNIDHLASVFRGVLEDAAAATSAPLTQAQTDRLAFDTVCTDMWMKGQSTEILSKARTAPTNAGSRGDQLSAHLKEQAKLRFDQRAKAPPAIRAVVHSWIDAGMVPMSPEGVQESAQRAELAPEQTEQLQRAWAEHIMATGDFWSMQSFMQGIWMHGIVDFDSIQATVAADGRGNVKAQEVYYAVLGHHMAGFIAAGFGRGDLRPNFALMEEKDQLPRGAAPKLRSLYVAAVELAAKWRPRIDRAAQAQSGLSQAERAEYRADASALREAIQRLPVEVQLQLLNDDAMQLSEIGVEKWLHINSMPTNQETLQKTYLSTAQAYLEEDLARSSSPTPAEKFLSSSVPVARRLGVTLNPDTLRFRLLSTDDPKDASALAEHAQSILQDERLGERFSSEGGNPGNAKLIVEWFRSLPTDAQAMARLAQK